jgi:dTDP-4-amino-4,6-dideoxygalactose transaminase
VIRADSTPGTAAIPFARVEVSPDARQAAIRVLASGWLTSGPEVVAFEEEFAALVGAQHAVAVSSCTAAIELSLSALGLPRGARVLTSAMTFCGAVNAILHLGLEPVLVDVDAGTVMPDAATTRAAARRAGSIEAMVVIHYAGHPAPVEELAAAAGLPMDRIVEDAAHALGTWVGDRQVGTISAATCFSFYATKNLPLGEGGMVTTGNAKLADYLRLGRLHGMSRDAWRRYLPGGGWRYTVEVAGLKANMTDLVAAIGRAQLKSLDSWQRRRAELAARYDHGLAGIPGLRRPPRPDPQQGRHAWHLYVIQVESEFGLDRDALLDRLAAQRIGCSVHFIPLHHQPLYRHAIGADALPGADAAFAKVLSLPFYPSLTDQEVDRVCAALAILARSADSRHAPSMGQTGSPPDPEGEHVIHLGTEG